MLYFPEFDNFRNGAVGWMKIHPVAILLCSGGTESSNVSLETKRFSVNTLSAFKKKNPV